ncbi:MAG: hydroxysqualene dehydroxylase HpnE [Pirellulales bacterium]
MSQSEIAVVGGGLAGMAAALRLAEHGCRVTLFEARRQLGGRASSFRDTRTGEWIDYCQHVSMGCCTAFADFCDRIGVSHQFERCRTITFIGPNGRQCNVKCSRWLPAPLHLLPSLLRMRYLSLRERLSLIGALMRLVRGDFRDTPSAPTVDQWLRAAGQSPRAIEQFWGAILVSALGVPLREASVTAARKVFIDGFLANRRAYELVVPRPPLRELLACRAGDQLTSRGVQLRLGTPVQQIALISGAAADQPRFRVVLAGGEQTVSHVILAVPWRRLPDVLDNGPLREALQVDRLQRLPSAAITGIHLWFDRPLCDLPHAVLVGRLAQWVFSRGCARAPDTQQPSYYYQVVISGSHALAASSRESLVETVCRELGETWPQTAAAQLVHWQVVSERDAVFSVLPGASTLRPPQSTAVDGLSLAGDWTETGWPSTMEGAVRSGYLAAQRVLESLGHRKSLLVPDLPVAPLAKLLLRLRDRL